ncbi:thiamine phosphate synthase [Leadbettera azotonutricia]|uniref:Thiamine-phosphate synthase n=1 Tax=Leadbettera azotonutricia (strain ATCC BAA-888 / DSM 13862 / ZAS-9) TaxID=545695 RepID=F5YB60_LEAAZ|nr:thiamine phosphate synthase [Leadbettera azotonutricia]AEF83389.1 thiamine-phosphate diphosphorylase [Leadbettera azotonutricia ZAS-9]
MLNIEDLKLYLCTDRGLSLGRPLVETVEDAIAGGVTMVQIREKDIPSREFYDLALQALRVTRAHHIPLIINDRLDIALAIGAEGVHLGQSDLPCIEARRVGGEDFIIGVSAHTPAEAVRAERDGADYIGAGAVFPTGSKADVSAIIGLDGLKAAAASVKIPVIGIGGIGPKNAAEVIASGAAGIAVISAILSQPDIREAAMILRRCLG